MKQGAERDEEMATISDIKTSEYDDVNPDVKEESDVKEDRDSDYTIPYHEDEEAKANRRISKKENRRKRKSENRQNKAKEAEGAPKPGMSAYFLFLDANREQIKEDNPGISFVDFGRMVDVQWGMADQSEWEEKALLDQERYENQMKDYNKAKGKKDTDQPKLGCSAYSFFLNDKREEIKEQNPGLDSFGIKKKAIEMFNELENKSEWEKKALLDQERYENEMKVYNKAKVDKRGISKAYYFFLNAKREEIREQNPDIDPLEIKKKATEMFNELEDKSEWEEKAMLDQKQKDKDAPAPAYYMFLNAKREEIKAQNPGIASLQIKRKAGEMFRELKDKSEWEEKARKKEEKVKEKEIRYKKGAKKRKNNENKKAKKMMYQL